MNRLFKKEQNSHKSESIERYKAYAAVFQRHQISENCVKQ